MSDQATPAVLRLNAGLGAAPEARCCEMCNDGDDNCVFPYYGVAPTFTPTLAAKAIWTQWR